MRFRSLAALAVVLSLAAPMSGCFGKFALVGKVYKWNDSLGNKFVKTVVFWALNGLLVYPTCYLGDYFVLNVIEFWSGSNPLAANEHKVLDDGSIAIDYAGSQYRIVPTSEQSFELYKGAEHVASAQLKANGGCEMTMPNGGVVRFAAPDAVTKMTAGL
jgi:hypothetical protein